MVSLVPCKQRRPPDVEPITSEAISELARNLHMFSLSSGFTINGGNFHNIGGDMNVYNTSPEDCT
jgi:hypothetical protein